MLEAENMQHSAAENSTARQGRKHDAMHGTVPDSVSCIHCCELLQLIQRKTLQSMQIQGHEGLRFQPVFASQCRPLPGGETADLQIGHLILQFCNLAPQTVHFAACCLLLHLYAAPAPLTVLVQNVVRKYEPSYKTQQKDDCASHVRTLVGIRRTADQGDCREVENHIACPLTSPCVVMGQATDRSHLRVSEESWHANDSNGH